MTGVISRRILLGWLAGSAVAAGPALAGAPQQSRRPALRGPEHFKRAVPGAERIIGEAKLGGHVCFAVADAATGRLLEGGKASESLPPASVAKAMTALYALEALGPGHRFMTRLVAEGQVMGGVLKGNLVLVGGGDPTLDTDDLAALAASLKAAGIRQVQGDFKVAEGFLPSIRSIDPSQPDHVAYSPAISGIALNFNRVHFQWKRASKGYAVTMDARAGRYRPKAATTRMQVADRKAPVYTYKATARREDWTVARWALGRAGSRWLPVRKPALYAGDIFQTLARAEGIALKAPKIVKAAKPNAQVLASRQSKPLRDILQAMLKFSNNLTAEMVGLAATRQRKGKVASLAGSAREMNQWAAARFGAKGVQLKDHSGLNGKNRMTPQAMVATLSAAHKGGALRAILKDMSMRDKGPALDVRAKTGTLNFVSGLAGYIKAADGRDLVFAIFAADEKTRARIARDNREAPTGAKGWNRRAKNMQRRLLARWGTLYGR